MVEISNARYAALIAAETTLNLAKEALKKVPSYKLDEALKIILADNEREVNANAE